MRVLDRIQSYLSNGGLFNPELMEHEKVRDLILECKDELIELNKIAYNLAIMDTDNYSEHDSLLFEECKIAADKWYNKNKVIHES
jgi:hypothetical protein